MHHSQDIISFGVTFMRSRAYIYALYSDSCNALGIYRLRSRKVITATTIERKQPRKNALRHMKRIRVFEAGAGFIGLHALGLKT